MLSCRDLIGLLSRSHHNDQSPRKFERQQFCGPLRLVLFFVFVWSQLVSIILSIFTSLLPQNRKRTRQYCGLSFKDTVRPQDHHTC